MPPLIITPSQMLRRGLRLAKITDQQQERRMYETNIKDFREHFGRHPLHLSRVWRDLQTTNNPDAHVDISEVYDPFGGFMAAHHFLWAYDTEGRRAPLLQTHRKDVRDKAWFWIAKMAALKPDVIRWPPDNEWETYFIATVDGKHRDVNEPRDEQQKRNPQWYSYKTNHAGVNNEIVAHLWRPEIIRVNEWDLASRHDGPIFGDECIHLVPAGRKVIADKGYLGAAYSHAVSTPNSLNPAEIEKFKARARARHENLNCLINAYSCMHQRFRHSVYKHQICLNAICVLIQYSITDTGPEGEPLDPMY